MFINLLLFRLDRKFFQLVNEDEDVVKKVQFEDGPLSDEGEDPSPKKAGHVELNEFWNFNINGYNPPNFFKTNKITTSKYTPINFVPKNFFE
jgi:hypothetical protein